MNVISQQLVIFTRYPEPGKTKTRLIPGIGAEGAAALQRQMTEHILTVAADWQESASERADIAERADIQVLTAGGSPALFQEWLGDRWPLQPQANGDLGERMAQAFTQGFATNHQQVVIIGIDCPDISPEVLDRAFASLSQQDLVLGPATDGGYYLIGLRAEAKARAIPALFDDMSWGVETVRSETLQRAKNHHLQVSLLEELTDVDHPEDLWVWQKYQNRKLSHPQTLHSQTHNKTRH